MSSITSTGTDNGMGDFAFRGEPGNVSIWIGFAFTFTATVVFGFLSYIRNVRPEARLTYYLVTLINAITATGYLTMALGASNAEGDYTSAITHNGERTFEWIRYAAWAICGPLTVFILGLLAGAHWVEIFFIAFAQFLSVAALFAATISEGDLAVWPLFTLAILVAAPVFLGVFFSFRISSYKVHPEVGKLYTLLAYLVTASLAGYVITWGCSEGGYVTTQDQEIIIYTVLDIFTKVVFGFVLIYSRESIARYGSYMGGINTGMDFDFPIARATYTGSGSNYVTEPSPSQVMGEHRDLAFASIRASIGGKPVSVSQEVRDRQSL